MHSIPFSWVILEDGGTEIEIEVETEESIGVEVEVEHTLARVNLFLSSVRSSSRSGTLTVRTAE